MSGTSAGNARRLVITAWSAVSPYGMGREALVEGLTAGRPTDVDVSGPDWDVPDTRACLVPGFDVRERLGRKGTRAMDRATGLALCAVGDLLTGLGDGQDVGGRDDTALVLGTSIGSPQSMMDFTRASLTSKEPFYVDPAQMPFCVMNAAAGQCAIWHQLRGPNTTLAGGRGTALIALRYARRLLANGRAARALVGATEDYSRARSWLWHHSYRDNPVVHGEGALVLLVELADAVGGDRVPLAEVLTVESRTALGDDHGGALSECILSALKVTGVAAADIGLVALSDAPGELGRRERRAVAAVLGDGPRLLPPLRALIGETASVSAAFQIGAVLAQARRPDARGGLALITSVDPDGAAGCALLRMPDAG
jgi:3-oxoacyl-[acyl-carrier-protein] synthase II